jgi:hypothetical protein
VRNRFGDLWKKSSYISLGEKMGADGFAPDGLKVVDLVNQFGLLVDSGFDSPTRILTDQMDLKYGFLEDLHGSWARMVELTDRMEIPFRF